MTAPAQFHYGDPAMVAVPPCWTHRVTPHPSLPDRGPDLPVKPTTGTYRTILRLPVPDVQPGDALDIYGRWRVTSELNYAVGIGTHLWQYDDVLGSSSPWTLILPAYDGENVIRSPIHHKPLHLSTTYVVPEDWPPGHAMTIAIRGDAHSTAAVAGDTVGTDGDNYAHLVVRRWTMPTSPQPEEPPMTLPATDFEMRIDITPPYEEGVRLEGHVQSRSFSVELEVILPSGATEDDAFNYVQAIMAGIKDKLETDFPGETWTTGGRFVGTVAGDPWTA